MKKVTIEIETEDFNKIHDLLIWLNVRKGIKNNRTDYTLEDFAKGALLSRLEEMEKLISGTFAENVSYPMKNNFKLIAKERNITQADVSRIANINKSTLSLIFNNELQPRSENFFKIWIVLGSPPIHECIHFED